MNNSLARLLEGIIDTLRQDILPELQGEFVRGQAFGIIYALNSVKLRAAWSSNFLLAQLDSLDELAADIGSLAQSLPQMPALDLPAERTPDPAVLERIRNQADASLCGIIDWLHANGETMAAEPRARLDAAIRAYVHRQLKHEIATSARPMFAEISSGVE